MKKGIFLVLALMSLVFQQASAVDADVLVRNQRFSGDTFFFDIYLQATGAENLFLSNSDFVLEFTEANFSSPELYLESGSVQLYNAYGSPTSYYDTNIGTRIEHDGLNAYKLMIIVQMPLYTNNSNFNQRIARIDQQELTHRLGSFYITGASALNTNPEISWLTAGSGLKLKINHRDSATFVKSAVNVNAVNPALETQPVAQAYGLVAYNIGSNSLSLSWNRGNGDGSILFIREGAAVNATPTDGLKYLADAAYGNGDEIGNSGVYTIYSGSDTFVTVTGLDNSTTYHFALMEYSGGNGWSENYLSSNPDTLSESTGGPFITANLTLFLYGPYNTGSSEMNTSLNSSGYISLSQPYSENKTGWNYDGQESVTSIPNSDIVDWVLVELRTGTAASDTLSSNSRRAGFLLKDGSIVDTNGVDPIRFYNVNAGDYYVVVRHRNHLAVMSVVKLSLSASSANYDFSTSSNTAYGSNALKSNNGVYCMIPCDHDANGGVNALDNNLWKTQNGNTGYYPSDSDMNGGVNALDNNLWKANNGSSTNVPN